MVDGNEDICVIGPLAEPEHGLIVPAGVEDQAQRAVDSAQNKVLVGRGSNQQQVKRETCAVVSWRLRTWHQFCIVRRFDPPPILTTSGMVNVSSR